MAQAMAADGRPACSRRRAFQNFGRYLVEVMRLPVLDPEEARQRVTFVGWEDLAAAQGSEGRGVLLCAVHTGAVDLLAPAMKIEGETVSAVADDTTYGRLYEHLAAVRGAHGVDVIGWRTCGACTGCSATGATSSCWSTVLSTRRRTVELPAPRRPSMDRPPVGRTAAILPVGVRRPTVTGQAWGYPVIRADTDRPRCTAPRRHSPTRSPSHRR
jgi:hypothetical protein